MWLIILKLAISLSAGALDALGGYCFLPARRFIMPTVMALSTCYFIHSLWPLTMILCMGTLVLGYKDFGAGNFSRGCWLFVQYLLMGLGLFLSGHLAWYFYFPYAVIGGVLGGLLVKWYQPFGDFIEGSVLGMIILFVR